jgi:hypothetical protein
MTIGWIRYNCINCDCEFYISPRMNEQRRKDKQSFYCPNGHAQAFVEGEADKLRRERDRLKQENSRLQENELRLAREASELETKLQEAKKKHSEKMRRVHAGNCPHCKRTFSNVARHMKSKHPNVVPMEKKTA